MSGQLESIHYFRVGDMVGSADGDRGVVIEAGSLSARIAWDTGIEEEVEQFDPRVFVVSRAQPE